jgi:hypothetical protein
LKRKDRFKPSSPEAIAEVVVRAAVVAIDRLIGEKADAKADEEMDATDAPAMVDGLRVGVAESHPLKPLIDHIGHQTSNLDHLVIDRRYLTISDRKKNRVVAIIGLQHQNRMAAKPGIKRRRSKYAGS